MRASQADAPLETLLGQAEWLRGFAQALVRGDDADDLVQETWVAALRAGPPGDRAPRPWLAHVLRNFARRRARGRSRSRAREAAAPAAPEALPTAEEALAHLETQRLVAGLLAALDEPYRATLLLRYFEGLSSAQVAARLGVPAGTVRWRLKEGLDRLRRQLDARHGDERRRWIALLAPFTNEAPGAGVPGALAGAAPLAGAGIVAVAAVALLLTRRPPPAPEAPPVALVTQPAPVPPTPTPPPAATPPSVPTPAPAATRPPPRAPREAPARGARARPSAEIPGAGWASAPPPAAARAPAAPPPRPALPTSAAVASRAPDPHLARGGTVALLGEVVTTRGKPLSQLLVYAVDAATGAFAAATRPEPGSARFTLRLPRRRHDFGVISGAWRVNAVEPIGTGGIRVVVTASPEPFAVASPEKPLTFKLRTQPFTAAGGEDLGVFAPALGRLRGRVVDETGAPLGGVQILVSEPDTDRLLSSGVSSNGGEYDVAGPAGYVLVRFVAPGLTVKDRRRDARGRVEIVMAVKTEMEEVVVSDNHVVRFKMSDSIWPEVVPPPPVKGWLRYAWGLPLSMSCSGTQVAPPGRSSSARADRSPFSRGGAGWGRAQSPFFCGGPGSCIACPLSVWERQWRDVLPRYWWLRLLRAAPPNPSVVADPVHATRYVYQVLGIEAPL